MLSQSAYGNKPGSLQGADPSQPAAIAPGTYQMPPMEITPSQPPAPSVEAPAPSGEVPSAPDASRDPAGVPADFASFDPNAAQAQAGSDQVPADFESFKEPQAQSVGGASGAYGVVQFPDGKFGVKEASGAVRPLTENEKTAAKYIATGLRMGGPTLGALLGGVAGTVGGPAGEAAGAGLGGVAGGETVHPMASYFESLAGEVPHERTTGERTLEAVLPGAGEAVASSLAKSGIQNVAKQAATQEFAQGAGIVGENAAARVATAEAAGGKLFKHETNAENPAVVQGAEDLRSGKLGQGPANEFQGAQISRGETNLKKLDQIFEKVGPKQLEEAAKAGDVKAGFDKLSGTFEARMAKNRDLAQKLAGDESLSIDLSDIKDKHPDLRDKFPGITNLKGLDKLVSKTQEQANFGALSRSVTERQYGKLSRDLRILRDTESAGVLERAGKTQEAQQLKADRNFYSSKIDQIREVQNRLESDPTYASKVLFDKSNPLTAEFVAQSLPKQQRQVLAREFIDGIANKYADREAKTFAAKAFDKELNSYDPKVLDAVLGDSRKEIQTFTNYLKLLDQQEAGAASTVADKAAAMYAHPRYATKEILGTLLKKLMGKEPKVIDYIANGHEVVPLAVRQPKFEAPGPLSDINPKVRAAGAGAVGGAVAGTIGALRRDGGGEPNRKPQSDPSADQEEPLIDVEARVNNELANNADLEAFNKAVTADENEEDPEVNDTFDDLYRLHNERPNATIFKRISQMPKTSELYQTWRNMVEHRDQRLAYMAGVEKRKAAERLAVERSGESLRKEEPRAKPKPANSVVNAPTRDGSKEGSDKKVFKGYTIKDLGRGRKEAVLIKN